MVSFVPLFLRSLRFNAFETPRVFSLVASFNLQNRRTAAITWRKIFPHYLSSAVESSEFESDKVYDDAKTMEKESALRLALSQLAGDLGKESMLSLQRFFGRRSAPVISTGSLKLDLALGIGGLPKGRIIEIYGPEASGKTTLALHVIREAQKLGGYCAYLDVENTMDPVLAESIGVNTDNLLISQPDSAENLLNVVDTLTKSGSVDVIVVDSVAALIPQREIDTVLGGSFGSIQKIMTQALRKISYSLCHSNTIIIFVNQVRSYPKSGQVFGHVDEVTCGGNALPFYAAIRLRISRRSLLKNESKVTGLGICVQVVKNKLAPAMNKAEIALQFGRGFGCECEALELACDHGVVLREGSSYFIEGKVLDSKEEAESYLTANDEVLDTIVRTLRSKLFEREN